MHVIPPETRARNSGDSTSIKHSSERFTRIAIIVQVQASSAGPSIRAFYIGVPCAHCSQAVLAVGNGLNGSTYCGGARGFQLDALSKVRQ